MAVTICGVEPGSPAAKARIGAGEQLLTINGQEIMDVLDYRFYMLEKKLTLSVCSAEGKTRTVHIKKREYDELGLLFDSYLMDRERSCRNKCIFCFIDQMPPGMRETLYFKDDDARLSFLYGNYITLTNLSEHDIERTIRMKISPVNISVHTTNPELRCKMMNNRFAGESLSILKRLADGGIAMNAQLVLCPGINDGKELERSLTDLAEYVPALQTVSCVPVGLTKFRDKLFPLRPYTREEAAQVIEIVNRHGDQMLAKHGQRIFYVSDEFYLRAGQPLPESEFYGDYSQLENGVGMLTLQREQFEDALPMFDEDDRKRKISIATGVAAAPFIEKLVDEARKKWHNLDVTVYPIVNDFFGHDITVAGLLTGQDLIAQLRERDLGEELLLPDVLLKFHEDVLLDDVTLDSLRETLGVPITMVDSDGYELLRCILGEEA